MDDSEAELPRAYERLAHALNHDARAPLQMLSTVLASVATADAETRRRRLAVAGEAIDGLETALAELAGALRTPIDVTGTSQAADVEEVVRRLWDELAAADDQLEVEAATDLPVAVATCEAILTDLLAHALADRQQEPRQVVVAVTSDGTAYALAVTDDGPPPGRSPAGMVRPVGGSTARALLTAQRLAETLHGRLTVASHDGAVRVTLYWPDAGGAHP